MNAITQQLIKQINAQAPLVHNITNYVVMNTTANALLAIGASPIMAHAIEEVEELVAISSSLVINMGTLSPQWVDAMILAAKEAKRKSIPFVFDPVGVGASSYRFSTAQKIISSAKPDVIRGNASEIMALAKITSKTKGVDSTQATEEAIDAAKLLSTSLNNTVVISGATDYIISQDRISQVNEGSPLMAKVTGMGCTATSIIGACIAVEKDTHLAASLGMEIMGVSGNLAAKISKGTGSFQINFIDSLFQLASQKV